MSYLKTSLCLSVLVVSTVISTDAEASHKAWFMKNSGASCVRQTPTKDDYYPGVVINSASSSLWVTCPVTLAARSGSSSNYDVDRKDWLAAKQARIHYYQPSTAPFLCQARAVTSGGVYYSRSRYSAGTGVRSISLIDDNDWGSSLEAVDQSSFEQLDFDCLMGSKHATNNQSAYLYGVDVATCQHQADCHDFTVETPSGTSWVQGSGIECVPSTNVSAPHLRRTVNGYHNSDPQTWRVSHCPITTGVDDSHEHSGRKVTQAFVYWEGPTKPSCQLVSRNYQGNLLVSPFLVEHSSGGYLRLESSFTAGLERSLGIECHQPPNTTIIGWVVEHSRTYQSAGL